MSTRRILGWLGAAAGIAAAGGAAAALRQRHIRARKGAGDEIAFGSLSSHPVPVTTSDGLVLHAEIDDYEPAEGERVAADEPTIIFVHGFVLNRNCWHFQRAAYRDQVRTVVYDQRSHGKSARSPESGCTIEQLGKDLKAVIDQTSSHGPLILVGHSMGGMTILSLAEQFPEFFRERVIGVGLIATAATDLEPGKIVFPLVPGLVGAALATRVVGGLARGHHGVDRLRKIGHKPARLITGAFAFGTSVPPTYSRFVHDMIARTPFRVIADFFPALADVSLEGAFDVLAGVPAVIACGTSDRITPVQLSRAIHHGVPDSDLLEIERNGHMVILESHEAINTLLDGLIAQSQHQAAR